MKRKSRARHAVPAAATPQEKPEASASSPSGEATRAAGARPQETEKIHVPEAQRGKVAKIMLSPEMSVACSMQDMVDECLIEAGIDPATVSRMLDEQGAAVAEGDLAQVRRSLAAQAAMLERMFHHLYRLAGVAGKRSCDLHDRYLRLALRAQAQSMRTLQVLGRLGARPARQAHRTDDKPAPVKTAMTVRPNSIPPAPAPHLVPNRMPPAGWQGPARGGARWGGGLSAPKR